MANACLAIATQRLPPGVRPTWLGLPWLLVECYMYGALHAAVQVTMRVPRSRGSPGSLRIASGPSCMAPASCVCQARRGFEQQPQEAAAINQGRVQACMMGSCRSAPGRT